MTIVMVPMARREMLRAAIWYERRQEGLGDRFLDEISASLQDIVAFPSAFSPIDLTYRRKLLNVFPFAIVYRVDGDTVTVLAIANFKRRPGYWRRRD
jgi:ParE toxin of type II toxin-antitoxin system, parDE